MARKLIVLALAALAAAGRDLLARPERARWRRGTRLGGTRGGDHHPFGAAGRSQALRHQARHDRRHGAPRRPARHSPRGRDRRPRRQRPDRGPPRQRPDLRRRGQGPPDRRPRTRPLPRRQGPRHSHLRAREERIAMRRITIAFICVCASLVAAVPAEAVLEGRNGRIAFTSGREGANDDQAQLYFVNTLLPGQLSQPFSIPGTQNRHASFSPDRTKVVFAAGTPGAPTTEEFDLFVRDFVANTITPLDLLEIGDGLSSDH